MILFSILSILIAVIAAAYLQLPTFILVLGYRWFHNYKIKRWIVRALALSAFAVFVILHPPLSVIISVSIPVLFFLIFSLINANPKVYIALRGEQILKLKTIKHKSDTEVLGYANEDGKAIAYPIFQLVKPRHLLNDTFEGNPLFVSYCMACRSAMVYNPVVNGARLHFEVLGVYRRNLVMGDVETGTIWQQGTGEAVYGKLKGHQLQYLSYQQMTIKEWLVLYPDSVIAYEVDSVKDGIFSKERLMKMMQVTERLVAPGKTDLKGLPLREYVFGVQIDEHAKAYPVSELKKSQGAVKDFIGNSEIFIEYDSHTNHIRVKEIGTGRELVAQSHWWFGWKEFHPYTEVWRANRS